MCSAAEFVFFPGVLITKMPFCVAYSMSILATPTAARAITFNLGACVIRLRSTVVSLLVTRTEASTTKFFKSEDAQSG